MFKSLVSTYFTTRALFLPNTKTIKAAKYSRTALPRQELISRLIQTFLSYQGCLIFFVKITARTYNYSITDLQNAISRCFNKLF